MIRLSEDGKTFVEIDCWEDLLARPGFRQKLDPGEFELKQIIGQYSISPKQPCGIKSCGTKHNRGYLVTASGGVETNIGNVCGKRIFGVDFTLHQRVFKRELNAQRYREGISAAQKRIDSIEEQVRNLCEGEYMADWCYGKMHAQLTRLFPERISRPLTERARRSNPTVSREIQLTEDERETGTTGGRSRYRTEVIFTISGISAVTEYKRLRTILREHLGKELSAFREIDSSLEDFESLKRWHNWINKIDRRLQEAEGIIEDCNRFLVPSNIVRIRNYRDFL